MNIKRVGDAANNFDAPIFANELKTSKKTKRERKRNISFKETN